jgi:feruloyl esterase
MTAMPVLAQSEAACTALLAYTQDTANLAITSAAHADDRSITINPAAPPSTLPPHCHVEGELDRRTGVDGKAYAIRFAINMPDNWNGRFLFQGGGGLNGTLSEPQGTQATGGQSALARGFAVVSTDSGHQGAGFDASFMADQEAMLNFYFLANARVTAVAKPLVEQYYSSTIEHAYFMGCSTGGREGMIMAQRFPLLYDGIVSGAPAMRTGLSNLALRWMNVQMNQAAPKDANGLPVPGGTYSKAEQTLIVSALTESCDALDGVADGLIFNTTACAFDPRTLACPAGQTENCLSPAKAEALAKAVAGPVDSRGVLVYPRFMLDTGIDDAARIPGIITGGGGPPVGPPVATMMTQDVDAEFIAATATDEALGNSTSYNLSTFAANGGKQLFYHGQSDPWFSAVDTLEYYQNMAMANGGLETVDQWSRLFLVPGMGHCQGGEQTLDSFDMLGALVDWVENAQPPTAITATGSGMPGISRPLCPYPQYPQYTGTGSSAAAENFVCTE